jgi:hypothetical protein
MKGPIHLRKTTSRGWADIELNQFEGPGLRSLMRTLVFMLALRLLETGDMMG